MMASTVGSMPGEQSMWVPLPTLGIAFNLPARLILVAAHSSADRARFANPTESLDISIDRAHPGGERVAEWHSVLDALAFAGSWRDFGRTEPTPYVMAGCAGWYGTFAYTEPSGARIAGALWAGTTGNDALTIVYQCDATQSETVAATSMAILASAHLIGTAIDTVPSPTTISCPQCGARNRVGSNFCWQCGAAIARGMPDENRSPAPTSVVSPRVVETPHRPLVLRRKGVAVIVAASIAAIVIFFIIGSVAGENGSTASKPTAVSTTSGGVSINGRTINAAMGSTSTASPAARSAQRSTAMPTSSLREPPKPPMQSVQMLATYHLFTAGAACFDQLVNSYNPNNFRSGFPSCIQEFELGSEYLKRQSGTLDPGLEEVVSINQSLSAVIDRFVREETSATTDEQKASLYRAFVPKYARAVQQVDATMRAAGYKGLCDFNGIC